MVLEEARVLLAHGDPFEAERLRRMLVPCPSLILCRDMEAALRALDARPCDLLIMPFALPGADAREARERLCAMKLVSTPAMLVLMPEGLTRYRKELEAGGVARVLSLPVDEEELLSAIWSLTPWERLRPDWAREERICALLDRLSIGRGLKGYGYLVRAVRLLASNGALMQRLKNEVYPLCAQDASGEAVERAMRHAIEGAWLRGDLETQYRLFGNTIDEAKGKPTNAEFLSRVVETLRMEAG